jgi:hypothetical protein
MAKAMDAAAFPAAMQGRVIAMAAMRASASAVSAAAVASGCSTVAIFASSC